MSGLLFYAIKNENLVCFKSFEQEEFNLLVYLKIFPLSAISLIFLKGLLLVSSDKPFDDEELIPSRCFLDSGSSGFGSW